MSASLPSPAPTLGVGGRRACVVSTEFVGLTRNGGIGTFSSRLCQFLVDEGWDVTALFAGVPDGPDHFSAVQREHADRGIEMIAIPPSPIDLSGSPLLEVSYRVDRWLRDHSFDTIHVHEWQGIAYHALAARHAGVAHRGTRFVLGIHSPTQWINECNRRFADQLVDLEADAMERACVRMADRVWTPTEYLKSWLIQESWTRAERVDVLAYLPPPIGPLPRPETGDIDELVFFGRLESRKGAGLFCDAIDRMMSQGRRPSRGITFLGRPALIDGQPAEHDLRQRAERWPIATRFLTTLDQPLALDYLNQPGRLAVLPSLLDNAPLALSECLAGGIPFVSTHVGGIPELVHPSDHDRFLCPPNPSALAERLGHWLEPAREKGVARVARPARHPATVLAAWREAHSAAGARLGASVAERRQGNSREHPNGEARRRSASKQNQVLDLPRSRDSAEPRERGPLVSVCIAHRNRPRFLRQAIESLEQQTYRRLEIIVVDDGSDDPRAIAQLPDLEQYLNGIGGRLFRQEHRYLGAARNRAAREANGDYLLFMDDDNIARPDELDILVRVARHTGADFVSGLMDLFEGDAPPSEDKAPIRRVLFAPIDGALGVVTNCFGDANSLVRRSAFERVGGFSEDVGVTHEDWELFARLFLAGARLVHVPEPIFWYRMTPGGMLRSTSDFLNHRRSLRAYVEQAPPSWRPILQLVHGQVRANERYRHRVSELEERLSSARYRWADRLHAAIGKVPGARQTLKGLVVHGGRVSRQCAQLPAKVLSLLW